uniref:Uncharacterized protein n=1 Tax=Rhizophora mucronata TaxID=61149 RepID=A0A2P2JH63_RHIMU
MHLLAQSRSAEAGTSLDKTSVNKMVWLKHIKTEHGREDRQSLVREIGLVVGSENCGPRNEASLGHFFEQAMRILK